MATSTPATTELTIVVTVHDARDRGGSLDYGLQSKKGELDPGTPTDDGGVRYECTARTRPGPDGSVNCTGDYLHGPSNERFLYISFRGPGQSPWVRRTKVMLPGSVAADVRRLTASVRDIGRSRAQFEEDWTASTTP
jgi:hypothetical protein